MSGDRRVVWVGRVAVVRLPAEVDISNAGQVRQELAAVVAQDASLVIADMSATTFCDSAGVTALVRAVRKANAGGAGLRVAASAPAVTRVLAITGVDRLIEIYPSVAAAMADPGNDAAGQDRTGGRRAGRSRRARPAARLIPAATAAPGRAATAGPGPRQDCSGRGVRIRSMSAWLASSSSNGADAAARRRRW